MINMSWFCGDNPCHRGDCSYDLWAPDHRSKIVNTAFSAYAYHQTCIDNYVERLAAADDPNDSATQANLLYAVGLSPDALTSDDIEYIEREVNKRYADRF